MSPVARVGRGRAIAIAICAAVIGVLSYVLGVGSTTGQQAEASVLDAASFTMDPPAPLNLVSVPSVALALVLIGGLTIAAHGFRRALVIVLAAGLAIFASQLLKQQLLTRPGLFEFDAPNTFPSGHMTVFTALLAAVIWAVPARVRSLVALLGALVVGAAAWQLLAFGWHRPSDVLGAQALVLFMFALLTVLHPPRIGATAALGTTVRVLLTALGVIAVLIALAIAAVAAADSASSLLLIAGELGVVGTGLLTTRCLLTLAG